MNIALILSGGTGTRMGGGKPKQYTKVSGRPVISYCLDRFHHHEGIDAVQIVAASGWQESILPWTGEKFSGFSLPGETRQLSILNGLKDILKFAGEEDRVIIHDAARPCVTKGCITQCLEALKHHEGCLPVVPMKDTVYECGENRVLRSLDRSRIMAGQAPEGFVLGRYYRANLDLLPKKILSISGSAEPAVLAGMDVVSIPGDEENFKITTKQDLERFEQIAAKKELF